LPVAWRLPAMLAIAVLSVTAGAQGRTLAIAPGRLAPEIDLKNLQSGRSKLSALRGHPVVVTFWGTWCLPCRAEFPELVAAHRKYREVGLEVIAVDQRDQELHLSDVQAFVKEFAVDFPVALDERGRSRRSFQLTGLPTTLFIDAAGLIQRVHSGPISGAELARGLAMILPSK